jgi:integrase
MSIFLGSFHGKMHDDTHSLSKNQWKPFLEMCNIPYRRIYNLRHTFATSMLQNGLDIVSLSDILGHKDITVTMTRYIKGKNSIKSILGKSVRDSTFK